MENTNTEYTLPKICYNCTHVFEKDTYLDCEYCKRNPELTLSPHNSLVKDFFEYRDNIIHG